MSTVRAYPRTIQSGLAALTLLCTTQALPACSGPSLPRNDLTEIWFQPQPATPFTYARPEIVGDVVLMGSPTGQLLWRDLATGNPRRAAAVCGPGGPQGLRLALSGSTIAVPCRNELIGLSLATGGSLWTYTPPPDTTHDDQPGIVAGTYPASDGTTIYVPAWGASVSALEATTGTVRWTWRAGRFASDTSLNVFRSGASGVAVSGDTVFVTVWHFATPGGGTMEAILLALDRATGTELWHTVMPVPAGGGGNVSAPPLLIGDLAIVSTLHGRIYGVQRSTGQVAWQYRSQTFTFATFGAPVAVDGVVYASTGDDRLTALNAQTGQVLWKAEIRGATKDLMATDRHVFVPSGGQLGIHNRATGALVATGRVKSTADGTFVTAAAARDGQVFITSTDGAWSFREPE